MKKTTVLTAGVAGGGALFTGIVSAGILDWGTLGYYAYEYLTADCGVVTNPGKHYYSPGGNFDVDPVDIDVEFCYASGDHCLGPVRCGNFHQTDQWGEPLMDADRENYLMKPVFIVCSYHRSPEDAVMCLPGSR